jgi:hypothetical protein
MYAYQRVTTKHTNHQPIMRCPQRGCTRSGAGTLLAAAIPTIGKVRNIAKIAQRRGPTQK